MVPCRSTISQTPTNSSVWHSAAEASSLRLVGNLRPRDGRFGAGWRQREKRCLAILLQHDLASADLAQDPAKVIVAESQPDNLVCGLIKEDAEGLLLPGHRPNKGKRR